MSERWSQSKIPLKHVYTPDDLGRFAYEERLNAPGAFPYTRGRHADTYARGAWIQRQLSGEGDAARSNAQLKYLLAQGQTGIDVIGDSPTMAWLDPDHPLAAHAVGTQGVSLCCLADYQVLYQDLPLEAITVSNSLPAPFAVACLYLVARERGVSAAGLRGSVVQFPLYGEDCSYAVHMPFELRLRLAADTIAFCSREMPRFHGFLEDTYYISEVGLDAVEEMALGFVEIRCVVRELLRRGLGIDQFAPRIAILLNCRLDLFEEIAKIRATRRLYARMMQEEFGARDPRSLAVAIACHTSGLTLTAQQPVNNIVRGALQAFALVLAGVQGIEISAFDEAYRTPSPESHLIGLRTQQVIHLETNVAKVTDPLGGSYYLEALTDEMERRIREMVTRIEAMGEPAALSTRGWFRQLFHDAMERYAREVRSGALMKVGVNVHQIPVEEDTLLKEVAERKMAPCVARIEQLRGLKAARDERRVRQAMQHLYHETTANDTNLIYPLIEAIEDGCTMGEVAGVMRLAYGGNYDPFNMMKSPLS